MKKILFTDKSETLVVEQAKVFVENDVVVYSQAWGDEPKRFNVPYRNLQVLVLGKSASITSDAMNKLAESGVVVATSKSGGIPMIMTSIVNTHPNEYMQAFCKRYFSGEEEKLKMAKQMMNFRISYTEKLLTNESPIDEDDIERYVKKINSAKSIQELLGIEGELIKNEFYHKYASRYLKGEFKREHGERPVLTEQDHVNMLLNMGNNIVYGLSSNAIWSLGMSPSFPLIHGRTNGSSFIYDVADLVKDATVLPWAFKHVKSTTKEALVDLRYILKNKKADHVMIDGIKLVCGVV